MSGPGRRACLSPKHQSAMVSKSSNSGWMERTAAFDGTPVIDMGREHLLLQPAAGYGSLRVSHSVASRPYGRGFRTADGRLLLSQARNGRGILSVDGWKIPIIEAYMVINALVTARYQQMSHQRIECRLAIPNCLVGTSRRLARTKRPIAESENGRPIVNLHTTVESSSRRSPNRQESCQYHMPAALQVLSLLVISDMVRIRSLQFHTRLCARQQQHAPLLG